MVLKEKQISYTVERRYNFPGCNGLPVTMFGSAGPAKVRNGVLAAWLLHLCHLGFPGPTFCFVRRGWVGNEW